MWEISEQIAETSYLNFIAIQLTGCHMIQDLSMGNLGTNCGNQLFEFYCNFTNWLPQDARPGCGEYQNKLLTALHPFFFRGYF